MKHSDIEHMAQGYPPSHIAKDSEEVIVWLATQLLATQGQRDALAASFDELAKAVGWTVEQCEHTGESPIDVAASLVSLASDLFSELKNEVKTPATDAYLNSVRATAFDDLYAAFVNHSERAGLSEDASVTLRECNDAVLHCCDQLLAGEPS